MKQKKIIVLSSGTGSILQSIIDNFIKYDFVKIVSIISDKPSLSVQRSLIHDINCLFLPKKSEVSKLEYDIFLRRYIELFSPDLIVLSGFMKILYSDFINNFQNKIINIHPSLLPKYKGLNTHEKVIMNKDKYHGTTIHYVDHNLDEGKIIAQKKFLVTQSDNKISLEKKVKSIEKVFYPQIIIQLLQNIK